MMLGIAQQHLPIQENHNFHRSDEHRSAAAGHLELAAASPARTRSSGRRRLLSPRRRAVAGGERAKSRDWAALVAERHAERERWSAVVPPRELGTPLPESVRDNPITTAFFGKKPEASRDPKIINGIGASAGTVTGPARIVRTLAEAHKLQPGDVLVCEMTAPA
jgi:hypothetical protein